MRYKMKCRICGAKLTKDGDICLNCYKKYQEEEDLKKDVNVILEVKRTFSIGYEIAKYIELIFLLIMSAMGCFLVQNLLTAIVCLIILIVLLTFLILRDKMLAKNSKVIFFERKVEYISKSWFGATDKIVKYTDLQDINTFPTWRQKIFGFGDLCVYAKGAIPGATLLNGFQLKDVKNINEVKAQAIQIVKANQK